MTDPGPVARRVGMPSPGTTHRFTVRGSVVPLARAFVIALLAFACGCQRAVPSSRRRPRAEQDLERGVDARSGASVIVEGPALPATPDDPLRDPRAPFTLRIRNDPHGIDRVTMLQVSSVSRDVVYTYRREIERRPPGTPTGTVLVPPWYRAQRALDDDQIEDLRRRLLARFRPLSASYRSREPLGETWHTTAELVVAGRTQRVDLSSVDLPDLNSLINHIHAHLLGQASMDTARPISDEEAMEATAP